MRLSGTKTRIREIWCQQCTAPCGAYHAGQIAHAESEAACPDGRWGAIVPGVAPAQLPSLRASHSQLTEARFLP